MSKKSKYQPNKRLALVSSLFIEDIYDPLPYDKILDVKTRYTVAGVLDCLDGLFEDCESNTVGKIRGKIPINAILNVGAVPYTPKKLSGGNRTKSMTYKPIKPIKPVKSWL